MHRTLRFVALIALVAATHLPAPAQASPVVLSLDFLCRDSSDSTLSTKPALGLSGLYAKPSKRPTQLVLFDHGYRKTATKYWGGHLREAAKHGALAVAMDYRGIGPAPDYRGWNVRAGAADTIKAAKYFLSVCRSIKQVFLLGVSMGGNTSGLAVAAKATRSNGKPLFDYWVDIEGAVDVTEEYFEASAAAQSGNEYAVGAQEDIEKEMGGTYWENPAQYQEETVVARIDDIAASGVKGVTIVHGLDDGLVPYNQSRQLTTLLGLNGIPVDIFTVGTRGEGESGTTLSSYAGDPIAGGAGQEYESPFAGHGAEESTTQLVINTGFDRLWALMKGAKPGPYREFFVDGAAGMYPAP
jgi:hypothetical protein